MAEGLEELRKIVTRAQRHGTHGTAAKDIMLLLALICLIASGIYWWGVQSELTESRPIAIAFTAILILAPPTLTSFLIPWSPGGQLLQKINFRTVGQFIVIGCVLYLLYYSYQLQLSWWQAQPVVADANLTHQQVLIGIIGFIIIPALLWTPVSSEELEEKLRQAHLVEQYRIMTAADIATLQGQLLQAQIQTLGVAASGAAYNPALAALLPGLIAGVNQTLRESANTVGQLLGIKARFSTPYTDEMTEILTYVKACLGTEIVALPAPDDAGVALDVDPTAPAAQNVSTASGGDRNVTDVTLPPPAIPQGGPANVASVTLATARETFGQGLFKAAHLAQAFDIADSTADQCMRDWRAAGHIEGAEIRGLYRFRKEA